jgi:NADP-dependent 3-hydroxy acid dehydrogenase YdfG
MADTRPGEANAVIAASATSGIGRVLALEFHRRGYVVYAVGRDRAALDWLAARGLRTAALDVTSADGIAVFVGGLSMVSTASLEGASSRTAAV